MNFNGVHLLGANLLLAAVVFVFLEYFCTGSCYILYEEAYTEPLFYTLISLLPTTLLLAFVSQPLFSSWLKRIASWFFPLTFIMITSVKQGQGLFPMTSDGRNDTATLMMIALFIITCVYVFVMRKRV
jgi:hypothetical protein